MTLGNNICLYVFGHRTFFPRCCLSSTSAPTAKQSPTQLDRVDAMTAQSSQPATLDAVLEAINRLYNDLRALDHKFSDAMSNHISRSFSFVREKINTLEPTWSITPEPC